MKNMDLYLDGQPLALTENPDFKSFEELCTTCSTRLKSSGRAIRTVRMDGVEVDCNNPPSIYELMSAERVEIGSCLLAELVHVALRYQQETAQSLADKIMELSTDCLIELPQETFEKWRSALESLKSLIGFIPHFYVIQSSAGVAVDEALETTLTNRIHTIQNAVDEARCALDAQDIVQFSDILELRMVPWLREHVTMGQQIAQIYSK